MIAWGRSAGHKLRRYVVRTLRRAKSPASVLYAVLNALLIAVGYALATAKSSHVQNVGVGLEATGIAGLVVFAYVLLQQETVDRLKLLSEFGLQRVFKVRSVGIREEYAQRTSLATSGIDIMGFGLNSLRQDFCDDFRDWARRCPVRILLLDPSAGTGSGSYAAVRDREEGATGSDVIKGEVEAFLRDTAGLRANNQLEFTVRLYKTLPTVNIFRIDNEMFFGPYLIKEVSRNMPTFLIREGDLYDALKGHFDRIWHDDNLSWAAP